MNKEKYSTQDIAEALSKANGYVTLAARLLKCEPKTIYRRIEKIKTLRDLLHDIREEDLDIAEQKLRQAIMRGEPWAISLKLKTQGKHRGYVERQELSGTAEGEPITFVLKQRND